MSRLNMLKGFLSLTRAWSICLVNAAIAYFAIAGKPLSLIVYLPAEDLVKNLFRRQT